MSVASGSVPNARFPRAERRALIVLVVVFVALLFAELPGSWLVEPDEARYAEIPREMLAAHDYITPTLNGAHYFEKPPLLYWLNAASMRAFGFTAYAARLPTRLAAVGTAVMLALELETPDVAGWGLWAALILLSAPLSFVLGRYNLTDGILTCAMTGAFLALRRFLMARERNARAPGALASLGACAALAMLAKGLIGIAFPGLVLIIWAGVTGRWRRIGEAIWSPAPVVFLIIAAPWFVLVERANPGFASIFFIREHVARFATGEAKRAGPIYYFVAAFLAGFVPWIFIAPRTVRQVAAAWRARAAARADDLFFAIWFVVILVFFSVSRSKLLPYILPAFPAAAALAARAILVRTDRVGRALVAHAVVVTLVALGGLGFGWASGELARYRAAPFAVVGAVLLVAGAWAAVARANTHGRRSMFPAALGWAGLYLAIILAMPLVANDLSAHDLAIAAAHADSALVVSYRCYPQEFPWVRQHPIAVADYIDELGSDGVRPPLLYWSRGEFWKRWNSGEHLVVVIKRRARAEFDASPTHGTPLAANRKYVVLANFDGAAVNPNSTR
ncbi:MAG TPA: phospholipid carrier-dependent glycosyltransferase [Gemmatimonadaceae bacterium]|nr:phospholipid carrier-dependent glycosyltransferase [Gemmatimonadaceae bacterium]